MVLHPAFERLFMTVERLSRKYDCNPLTERILACDWIWATSGSVHENTHHYGVFGLADHTNEVINLCEGTISAYELGAGKTQINGRELFLSALFHDVGKAWDYKRIEAEGAEPTWAHTPHKSKIHHITRSVLVWRDLSVGEETEETIDAVTHNILSHHGRREWGSPVLPISPEAIVLHNCDAMSARLYEA